MIGKKISLWLGIVVVVIFLLASFSHWIVTWLWLNQFGYSNVFVTIKLTQIILMLMAFVASGAFIGTNAWWMNRTLGKNEITITRPDGSVAVFGGAEFQRWLRIILTVVTVVVAALFAFTFFYHWDTYFRFHWRADFGKVDPIFHKDFGFYLFRLPFLNLIQGSFSTLEFLLTGAVIAIYVYSGQLSYHKGVGLRAGKAVTRHISVNLAVWLLLVAWGFFLDRYELLSRQFGVVYGIGYTDAHVVIPVLWLMIIACIVFAVLAIFEWFVNKPNWAIGALAIFVGLFVLGRLVLPGVIQSFIVEPNELKDETPYLKNNIKWTNFAYGMDKFHESTYDAVDSLRWQQIQDNEETVHNIRLWDHRALIQTYRQLQEIRTYYQFYQVNVDRYKLEGRDREVMLSARELAQGLPGKADTWVNEHLQYTHGYGLAMSPVAEKGEEGVPKLYIKDLPPVTEQGLKVDQPSIYYGNNPTYYRVVNTSIPELDYPKGDNNVYSHYSGNGGVQINGFWRRLLFAWDFRDINLLLSGYIRPGSKIQFWQSVRERIRHIAPFLKLDSHPYLVLNNGRLYWIEDAYTIAPDFPYSETYQGEFSYIRNSVKVVVDAYNGSVNFYVMQPNEPVLQVYRDAFPELFKPFSDMPNGLQQHIRYPLDLFEIQMEKYNTYHMKDPRVFYNNEDLWSRPMEKYAGSPILMEPYYVLTKLPGETKQEYMLISPLTPSKRDNMIAWMAAKCDPDDYGNVLVYQLPKEKLVYGPNQIEARIDQNTDISQQLSLWDQRGSHVIRGNLMVIPIDRSFLYVEPVFLIAEGLNIPQLQRVIVSDGEKTVMRPTMDEALGALFGTSAPIVQSKPSMLRPSTIDIKTVKNYWQKLQKAMKAGNWQDFGKQMNAIQNWMDQNSTSADTLRGSVK